MRAGARRRHDRGIRRRRVRGAQRARVRAAGARERRARCCCGSCPFARRARSGRGPEVAREGGAVTVQNPCLSGGAIEVFLVLPARPAPRVVGRGRHADRRRGPSGSALSSGSSWSPVDVDGARPGRRRSRARGRGARAGRAARAAPGGGRACRTSASWPAEARRRRDRRAARRRRVRGAARADRRARGIAIGARTAGEIALSILAKIVAVRRAARRRRPPPPRLTAVDPICGMTVAAVPSTLSLEREGRRSTSAARAAGREFEAHRSMSPPD